jgi:signal transduction histidine kinase
MNNSTISRIRPAARHILTIGKGLIKDNYTALGELVKNAYDADSPSVSIKFSNIPDNGKERLKIKTEYEKKLKNTKNEEEAQKLITEYENELKEAEAKREKLKITIKDYGHGMSSDTVIFNWLVPSTDNKLNNPDSKSGKRKVQGRKGIGRYSASILGESILMQTIDEDSKQKTEVYIVWELFEDGTYQYLDEVPILVETVEAQGNEKGTYLEIISKKEWTNTETDSLINELKRLVLPTLSTEGDLFNIKLNLFGTDIPIEPYPILDYYHYRIFGTISPIQDNEIKINAVYENNYFTDEKTTEEKSQTVKLKKGITCGIIEFDIRVVDLGIKDKSNLNERNKEIDVVGLWEQSRGVSVFRGDFRIRPYGNPKVDWLGLDFRRINNPGRDVSNTQVLGIIKIQDEKKSGLEEKATREGLKENDAFEGLKECVSQALLILELERQPYKKERKIKDTPLVEINQEISQVSNFTDLSDSLQDTLTKAGVDDKTKRSIEKRIKQEAVEKKIKADKIQKVFEEKEKEAQEIIAIFQTQATLGKVLTQVFHESRNYLHSIRGKVPNMLQWSANIRERIRNLLLIQDETIDESINKTNNNLKLIESEIDAIDVMYKKLKPLTITKRRNKKVVQLSTLIKNCVHVFDVSIDENKINVTIDCDNNLKFTVWEDDLAAIFINLLDNSIYWLNDSDKSEKKIDVKVQEIDSSIIIDFTDNGIGLTEDDVSKGYLFDLGYSKKTDGTGIGLYVAGDAAKRNNGELQTIYKSDGAHFRLIFKIDNVKK